MDFPLAEKREYALEVRTEPVNSEEYRHRLPLRDKP